MRKLIQPQSAPEAIGTYSQAISTGNLTFISGQIPLDPSTMDIIEGDFKDRARCVFNNIKGIAEESGANLNDIVKITIYLTDLANFASVNEVMLEYFDSPFPARAAIQVSALPKDVDIEADAIVAHDNL